MTRVLVSRPLEDAERTAARLAALGHEAVVAPVLVVAPTGEAPPAGAFDALVLTSANAVPPLTALPPHRCPVIFAVGRRTAAALADVGFGGVRSADGDAAALATLIAGTLEAGAALLHVAGRDHKAEPERTLRAAGFRVATWTAYAANPATELPRPAQEALRSRGLAAALHYSRRSAATLVTLAERAGLLPPLAALDHFCLSPDVAEPLRDGGAQRLAIAEHPDEDALLELLRSLEHRTVSPAASSGC